jgi:hypothetical protein
VPHVHPALIHFTYMPTPITTTVGQPRDHYPPLANLAIAAAG